jgi:hypothetical protein
MPYERHFFVTTSGISLESEKFHPSKKSKTTAKNFWSGLEFLEVGTAVTSV